ncbi:MAG TPA: hypothetical protein VFE37_12410 [Chloroflexota bacterium]|nr:hypothetical protein [Chloroflexota bacterium]
MGPRIHLHPIVATQSGPQVQIPSSYVLPGRPPLTCMPAIQPGALLDR